MQRRVAEGRPRKSRTHSLTSRNSATVLLSFFFFKADAALQDDECAWRVFPSSRGFFCFLLMLNALIGFKLQSGSFLKEGRLDRFLVK